MRWLRTTVARVLLYVAVALLVATALADLYGVKLTASYEAQVPSSQVGAAVMVVMPTTVNGTVRVNVTGAEEVLYLTLGTNPIGLLPEVKGLGLKVVSEQVYEDFRAGVIFDVAGLQGNPIFVEQAFQGVVRTASPTSGGVYIISSTVSPHSYLVVVAVPSDSSQVVTIGASFRVTGYGRLSNAGAVAAAVALVVAAVAYDLWRGRGVG